MFIVACLGARITAGSLVFNKARNSSSFSRMESSMMVIVTGSLVVVSLNSSIANVKISKSTPAAAINE